MKPNNNKNRYGRFNNGYNGKNRHNGPQYINKNTVFDSTGPCGRIRGTAIQLSERYLQAAKDALSEDDRVLSENCAQHAEHYTRLYQTAIQLEQERYQQQQAQRTPAQPQADDSGTDEPSDAEAPTSPPEGGDSFNVPAFLQAVPPAVNDENGDTQEEASAPKRSTGRPQRRVRKTQQDPQEAPAEDVSTPEVPTE